MNAQMSASATAARAHQEMFAYWASLRRGASLPSREDLHPAGIKRMLPTVSLIDVKRDLDGVIDYRLRLAGTGRYASDDWENAGRPRDNIYTTAAVAYWRREPDKVVTERRPGVGVHSLAWKGSPHMSILWLRLPLASNGKDVDMILGYDAVVGSQAGDQHSGIRAA